MVQKREYRLAELFGLFQMRDVARVGNNLQRSLRHLCDCSLGKLRHMPHPFSYIGSGVTTEWRHVVFLAND